MASLQSERPHGKSSDAPRQDKCLNHSSSDPINKHETPSDPMGTKGDDAFPSVGQPSIDELRTRNQNKWIREIGNAILALQRRDTAHGVVHLQRQGASDRTTSIENEEHPTLSPERRSLSASAPKPKSPLIDKVEILSLLVR